jgi:hypothetical protein
MKPGRIRVIVTRSVEAIDFDAWATSYVNAVLDADERKQLSDAA